MSKQITVEVDAILMLPVRVKLSIELTVPDSGGISPTLAKLKKGNWKPVEDVEVLTARTEDDGIRTEIIENYLTYNSPKLDIKDFDKK